MLVAVGKQSMLDVSGAKLTDRVALSKLRLGQVVALLYEGDPTAQEALLLCEAQSPAGAVLLILYVFNYDLHIFVPVVSHIFQNYFNNILRY